MERRYQILAKEGVRNIDRYNAKMDAQKNLKGEAASSTRDPTIDEKAKDEESPQRLPYIVIVIDELSDLMMVSSRQVEEAITRLAQMARAAGIHLVVATQRPSVDVLTGIIKANLPVRISFQVSSKTDSRTILDTNGAESLLGAGDMLFMPPGTSKLQRVHGAYVSEVEVMRIVEFLKKVARPDYDRTILTVEEQEKELEDTDFDDRYDDAIALVSKLRQASISLIQRHLRIGYNRAARIIEKMERDGIVGPSDGSKPRNVLIGKPL
jgi:S-DNA-T family DNA segregation ATPase FtsK/SpoIIIE